MKYILFLILTFSCIDLSSQVLNRYTRGTVYFLDGEVYDCEIGFPLLNKSGKLGLTVRSKNKLNVKSISGEKEKIENDEIDYIVFEGEQGYFKLIWTYSLEYARKYKTKKSKKKSWYLENDNCEDIISYSWADKYELDKNGAVSALYIGSNGFYGLYYLKRPNEEYPTLICNMTDGFGIGFTKFNKKIFEEYFKDDSHAIQFIDGRKKIKAEEIQNYIEDRCAEK